MFSQQQQQLNSNSVSSIHAVHCECLSGLSHQDKQICDSCKCDLTMWFFMHANCPWLPGTKMCPKEHPVPFLASKRFGVFTSVYILLLLGVNFVSFIPKLLCVYLTDTATGAVSGNSVAAGRGLSIAFVVSGSLDGCLKPFRLCPVLSDPQQLPGQWGVMEPQSH